MAIFIQKIELIKWVLDQILYVYYLIFFKKIYLCFN